MGAEKKILCSRVRIFDRKELLSKHPRIVSFRVFFFFLAMDAMQWMPGLCKGL
jgi:hypothetical protein